LRRCAAYLLVVILCLCLLILPIRSAQQSAQVISSQGIINGNQSLGWLHTEGRYIKDKYGRIVYFVGCAESQTSWRYDTHPYWRHEADPVPMANRMAELNVTWVRICVSSSYWFDPTIDDSYKDLIDRYVQEFTSRGIYCTVSVMGFDINDVPDNPTPWLNFLTQLTNRYKNNSGMCGIYIWNEPPHPPFTLETWRQWAVLGVQAVHSANPNLLKIVEVGLGNREGMDPYWASNPIPVPNVVYAYHDYFWQYYYYGSVDFTLSYEAGNYSLAKQQMEQRFYDCFFKYAVEYNMCIMLEEFGFNGGLNPAGKGYGNEPGWPQCQIDYMDLLTKYQIPWNQFDWWVKNDENYGLTIDGDYHTLSSVGQIWVGYVLSPSK